MSEDEEAHRPSRRGGSVRIRVPGEQTMGRRGSSPKSPHSSLGDLGDGERSSPTGEGSVGFDPEGMDEDGMSSGSGEEDLPFPGLHDKVFRYLSQTSKPRVWCIQLVCWPYPFYYNVVTLWLFLPIHVL